MKIDQVKIEAYKQMQSQKTEKNENVKEKDKEKDPLAVPEDQVDISLLKEEAEKAFEHLRTIVEDMLRRQGIEIEKLDTMEPEEFAEIKVDDKAREEAKQMIEGDGPLSPEKVSDRIVDFAKAISGEDKEKLGILKDAIEEGFKAAEEYFGELPDISQKTYDLIQEKLEAWENE